MRLPAVAALLFFLAPLGASAQVTTDQAPAPAHVSYVEGAVLIERDGRTDDAPANMPLLAGDRVRTRSGRAEVLFGDGSTLRLDANTTVDFQSDSLIRVLEGRIRLSIPGPRRAVGYRADTPSASADIGEPGEYRLSVASDPEGEVELAVLRGAADLVNEAGRTSLRAGERAFARGNAAPSYAYVFNSAAWDGFDRWCEARRSERLGISAEYLPDDIRPYSSAFDRYGSWRHDDSYGYVWYPAVAVDWRPYYYGRWESLRPFGWTWIGTDPWAWPTHHYGRWGFSAGAWFWIPGRTWGPAWVSWAYAPGYVSWCPLGWNNRPVVQIVNVNVYGRGYDPWRAWTVVESRHFGRDYVHARVVAARTFDARTRSAFVTRNTAPAITGYAVPRGTRQAAGAAPRGDGRQVAPIRSAGAAGPRRGGGTPVYTNLEPRDSRVGQGSPRIMVGPARRSADPGAQPSRAIPRTDSTGRPGYGRVVPQPGATRRMPDAAPADAPASGRYAPLDRGVPRAMPRGSSDTSGGASAPAAGGGRVPPAYRSGPAPPPAYGHVPDSGRVPESGRAPSYGRVPDSGRVPDYGRAPERRAPDMPRPYERAIPRNEPQAAPPPSYRPSPGIERRSPGQGRPSGPPPSAAPERSAPSRSAPPARDRGGAPASGAARPRGGGGEIREIGEFVSW